ncbi:LPS export ABC transporter permease LptF [Rahnella woolbedingensis]|uniref:Lipopolysaccharide export system permease protein LptF n=1 Tax=Rahnella woolbedingensis TaxID=1510574 RepID=A0A419NAT7_9GAMM|nr:LPS export ABC transporter permease LptF [Rahnella woolbedingensis]RJT45093.1 LPS export ABC transporter permease LptF [Rahnella woolbedingensis]
MYLIERYIMGETRRSVTIIVGFLTFIFASYSTQRYLTDAANGIISLQAVFYIVFYKVLIALEMLLPVGLYVSVAIALGQLHSDSEVIAILASGCSPLKLYKAILYLAIPVGILVTVLSMYARPWAYSQIYQLKQQSQSELDTRHLQAKKFNLNDSGRMILAEKIDSTTQMLTDVLIYTPSVGKTYVFRARSMQVTDPSQTTPSVMFHAGTAYELDHQGSADNGQTYNNFNLHPKPARQETEVKSKAASNSELSRASDPAYKAELQWRESRGISAILMALLAISLSRTKPRQGRFSTLLPLAIVFTIIFYAGNISRTLVANHTLPTFPGVWLVPLLMLISLLILLAREFSLLQKLRR